MKSTFGTLSALINVEFIAEYVWLILVLFILSVFTTAYVVFSICNNVIFPRKIGRINYIMPNYRNALSEIEILKEDNNRLREELEKYKNNKG